MIFCRPSKCLHFYLPEEGTSTATDEELPVYDEEENKPELKVYSGISPEIGIAGKIFNRLVLRYTFQYRFAVSKEYEDKFSRTRHAIGIGFCY